MKKKIIAGLIAGAAACITLAGCSSGGSQANVSYKDGVYEGTSKVHDGDSDGSGAGFGMVKLTITEGKITGCEYTTYEPDGKVKDAEYGKKDGEVANKDFYNKAQRAVQACQKYAEQLASTGDINSVDAISGATISYEELKEAVADALDKAKQ